MKRLSVLFIIVAIVISIGFAYHSSQATPAPLPTTLDVTGDVDTLHDINGVSGRSLYTSDLIQPVGNWTVSLDYTSLNGTTSVLVLGASGSILDIKRGGDSAGNLTFTENLNQPVRLSVYASSWHLVVH